jgi:phosphoribosylglycinamide formyltransferase 2
LFGRSAVVGLFGVEFFIAGDRAILSELSPRPHDTGMVTLIEQEPNEFELHLRAILGLPLGPIVQRGPSASAVILADRPASRFRFAGVDVALALGTTETPVDLRLFGKPETLAGRRMGVALARGTSVGAAVATAKAAAAAVAIVYDEEK